MKRGRYSESQIAAIVKEGETGVPLALTRSALARPPADAAG